MHSALRYRPPSCVSSLLRRSPPCGRANGSSLRSFHSHASLAKANRADAAARPKQTGSAAPNQKPQPQDPKVASPTSTHKAAASLASRAAAFNTKPEQYQYPPTLLIYNAGRVRIFAAAAIKMTSLFLFIFGATWLAPLYYTSEELPTWMAFAIVAGSTVPTLTTVYAVPRFVCYIHMVLPSIARTSQARLQRFAEKLPPTTSLDVTTLRWLWPRVSRIQAGELYVKEGSALNNLALRRKVPQEVLDARKWYHWRPLQSFLVIAKGGKVPEEGIWEIVINSVVRRRTISKTQRTSSMPAKAP